MTYPHEYALPASAPTQIPAPSRGDGARLYWDVTANSLALKRTDNAVGTLPAFVNGVKDVGVGQIKWTSDTPLGQDIYLQWQPTEASSVPFVIGKGEFPNSGTGGPRHNQVWTMGWNMLPGNTGRIIGGSEINLGFSFEYYYQPGDSSTRVAEPHLIFTTAADVQRRPLSWALYHTTGVFQSLMSGDRIDFLRDAGGDPVMTFQNQFRIIDLGLNGTQVFLRCDYNNAGFFYQKNAALSNDIELIRVDSSDRVVVAPGGGATKIPGQVGFQGTNPIAKPTVTGAKGGNAALTSLLTALASYGLITDNTT